MMRRAVLLSVLCGMGLQMTVAGESAVLYAQADNSATDQTPAPAGDVSGSQNFTDSKTSEKSMHLIVGHTVSVKTQRRISKIYVTNPAVLFAYTASPNELLLTSKQPGISSAVVWDESGESQSYLVASNIDISPLEKTLHDSMPKQKIVVQADGERVLLSGMVSDKNSIEAAIRLAGLYSKDVSNSLVVNSSSRKEVKLLVRIIEIDRSKVDQFGFNFFNSGGKILGQSSTMQFPSGLSTGSGSTGTTSATSGSASVGGTQVSFTNALNFLLYSSQLNVGAMLQDLQTKQVLQILAEPTITTLDGEKASFLAGGEFPFPVVQGGAGGLTSISIQFRPYGVKLDFTPNMNPDGSIELKVAPEVSALDYTNAVQISGYTIPALSTRRAETQVVLNSGQSFAISGLLDKRATDQLSKTPGIASVPIIGQLFKSKNINHATTELVVVVTPELIDTKVEPPPITEPKLAVPMLDNGTFDKAVGADENKTKK